jgi:hypothetical protein
VFVYGAAFAVVGSVALLVMLPAKRGDPGRRGHA